MRRNSNETKRPGSRRRWPWIVLGCLAFVVLLIGLAPWIASSRPVRHAVLARLNTRLAPANLSVEDWSLSWFEPNAITGLHFTDAGKGLDARVAKLGASNGLAAMLTMGKFNLGTITVSEPHVLLRLPQRAPATVKVPSSNLAPSGKPTVGVIQPVKSSLPDLAVKLVVQDGRIEIVGAGAQAFVLERLGLTAEIKSLRDPVAVTFTTDLPYDKVGGWVSLEGTLPRPEFFLIGGTTTTERLTLEASKLDLRSLRPLLETLTGQPWIRSGMADGKIALNYRDRTSFQVKTELTIGELSVEPPGKPLSPPGDVRVQADISYVEGHLTIRQFACFSPWVEGQAEGQFAVTPDANGRRTGEIAAKMDADLVALTRDFGSLLKLNDKFQLERGKAHMELALTGTSESVDAKGSLTTEKLALRSGNEMIEVQPSPTVKLNLSWPYTQPPEVRELLVELPFVRISGQGRLDDATLKARLDLAALSMNLRRVATNWPDMTGIIDAEVKSRREGDQMVAGILVTSSNVSAELQPGRCLNLGRSRLTASAKVPLVKGMPTPEASDIVFAFESAAGTISGAATRFVAPSSNRTPLVVGGRLKAALDLEATRSLAAPFLAQMPTDTVLSGKALMDVSFDGTAKSMEIEGILTTENPALRSGKQTFAIQPSPTIKAHIFRPYGQPPELRELLVNLPFARISGQGRMDAATLKASMDLAALSRDFRRVTTNCPDMQGAIEVNLKSYKDGEHLVAALLVTSSNVEAELQPGRRLTFGSGRLTASAKLPLVKGMPTPEASDIIFACECAAGSISGAAARLVPPSSNRPPLVVGGRLKAALDLEATRSLAAPWLTQLPPDASFKGKLTFEAQCTTDNQGVAATLNAALDQFSFAKAANQPFLEPHAELAIKAALTDNASRLTLAAFSLNTSLADLDAKGQITELQKRRMTELSGTLAVDFDKLNQLARAQGRPYPTVAGKQTRPFAFKGPLGDNPQKLLAQAQANAAVYLASAEGYGLAAGPADIAATLSDGVLQLNYAPTLNQGTLQLMPSIDATTNPMVLSLPPRTRILQNAKLTQEMLDQALTMMLPLLHGSGVMDGSVDLTMQNCRIPLGETLKRDTTFTALLTLRNVRLAPTGILGTVLQLAGLGGKEITIQQHELTAECKDGRVTPSPLVLTIAGNKVTLTGTVGLDGTLAYTAKAPLSKTLVGKEAEKYLEGAVINVPIAGTVKSPTIDRSALNAEIKRLGTEALKKAFIEKAGDLLKNLKL